MRTLWQDRGTAAIFGIIAGQMGMLLPICCCFGVSIAQRDLHEPSSCCCGSGESDQTPPLPEESDCRCKTNLWQLRTDKQPHTNTGLSQIGQVVAAADIDFYHSTPVNRMLIENLEPNKVHLCLRAVVLLL